MQAGEILDFRNRAAVHPSPLCRRGMETVTGATGATVWHMVECWSSFECRLEAGRVFPGWDMVPASFCPRQQTLQYQTRSTLEAAACFVENQVY